MKDHEINDELRRTRTTYTLGGGPIRELADLPVTMKTRKATATNSRETISSLHWKMAARSQASRCSRRRSMASCNSSRFIRSASS